jgi:hypothetical protein
VPGNCPTYFTQQNGTPTLSVTIVNWPTSKVSSPTYYQPYCYRLHKNNQVIPYKFSKWEHYPAITKKARSEKQIFYKIVLLHNMYELHERGNSYTVSWKVSAAQLMSWKRQR